MIALQESLYTPRGGILFTEALCPVPSHTCTVAHLTVY